MATDKSQKMLRAKALECISLVGMAVGKDLFREDAHAVMRFMQVMQVLMLKAYPAEQGVLHHAVLSCLAAPPATA